MCDQQGLRSACAYAQSDQSISWSFEYSMTVQLLIGQNVEFLSLTGGCTGSSESNLSKCHIVGNHMSRLNYINPSLAEPRYEHAHVISVLMASSEAAKVQASMRICTVSPKPSLLRHTQNMDIDEGTRLLKSRHVAAHACLKKVILRICDKYQNLMS